MPVMAVMHRATTVNLSILSFIVLYLFFYYTLLSDWVALLYPSLALFVNAVSFFFFSECKKESKEKHKEDSEAHYRRARPFAFDEVD